MPGKTDESKRVTWIIDRNQKGEFKFTFDGKRIFSLFRDYPYELTPQQKQIFDEENPYWAEFFDDRS